MKTEIKINNSKLKISLLDFKTGDNTVIIPNKTGLKYQFIVFTNPVNKKSCPYKMVSSIGLSKIQINPLISKEYTKCWVLEQLKHVPNFEGNSYTKDELNTILSFLSLTILDYQDTSEILSLCTKDKNIIAKYYESYGKHGLEEFRLFIKDIIKNSEYKVKITEEFYPLNYLRDRYSIQSLISDLISDKASILTNKYLVGEVKNISSKKEIIPGTSASSSDEWYKVTGVMGNKTRANLNLMYSKKVLVNIPKNDFGIEEGLKEYNTPGSICLVKDGRLWQKMLGVRVSSKLSGKLKRLGIVSESLLYPGELLVDLTKIPVISKSRIREITSDYLSSLEVKTALSNIAVEYLEYIYPDSEEILSDKDKFLAELGIKGDTYYPKRVSTKSTESYNVVELKSEILGIPETYTERVKHYSDIKSGTGTGVIKTFIQTLGTINDDNIDDLKKFWRGERNKNLIELRDRKFQIILSKKSRFSEKRCPFIDSVIKNVCVGSIIPGTIRGGEYVTVSWKFKNKKVNV